MPHIIAVWASHRFRGDCWRQLRFRVRPERPGPASPASAHVHEVGVVKAARKTLQRTLVVSSELVPFQQIDVYAKESGFVRELNVDYGTQ